jgi:polysaccharide export outer membrane protein
MLLASLTGCGLPAAAPTSRELVTTGGNELSYALVDVDSRVVAALHGHHTSFGAAFRGSFYTPKNTLRPGDAVAITVYETGGSSLFPAPEARATAVSLNTTTPAPGLASANTVPPQVVEADGTIRMPFVGRLKVTGLTPGQVAGEIEKVLSRKAVAPQVVVTLAGNASNAATVSGEVNGARTVPLSLRGERLLDVIAAAGGAKYPAYETYVHVVRKGHVGTMLLQAVVSDPVENIVVQPNDQVYLMRNPRTFAVLGATQRPALFPFDRERVTLAEAVAQAGGPVDAVGDPSGIYLFRYEPLAVARQVLGAANPKAVAGAPEFVPVLYHVDLRSAEGYFLSQAIQLRDKDIVLVTNAEGTQLQKMLSLVRGFTGIAYDLKRQYVMP